MSGWVVAAVVSGVLERSGEFVSQVVPIQRRDPLELFLTANSWFCGMATSPSCAGSATSRMLVTVAPT